MDLNYNGNSIHVTKLETRPSGRTAVVLHGMCMYGDYYHCLSEYLPDDFARFYFIDMVNHGRSSGPRGYLPDSNEVLNILDFAVESIKREDRLPKIDLMVGASMGGIFALSYLLNRDREASGKYLIFGAPLYLNYDFFLHLRQPKYLYAMLFAKDKPVLPVKILIRELVSDTAIFKHFQSDSLIPTLVNFRYVLTVHQLTRNILKNYGKITNDILFIYGEKDAITNVKRMVRRNRSLKSVETIVVPKRPHSVLWTDKVAFVGAIREWLGNP